MNLLYLKYAVEIAETNSITKAAERFYTSQPNLSRAVRELENTLGITVFKRSPKGIYPTAEGEEFLCEARKILKQVDRLENIYSEKSDKSLRFSVSSPRAAYIEHAFTEFVKSLDPKSGLELFFDQTRSPEVVAKVTDEGYRLGILRYRSDREDNFREMFRDKELVSELIYEFNYKAIISSKSQLANHDVVTHDELSRCCEVIMPDSFSPSPATRTAQKDELTGFCNRRIFVSDRSGAENILACHPDTFMWSESLPQSMLDEEKLIQKRVSGLENMYRDVLVYRKGYVLTKTDKAFIDCLIAEKRSLEP